MAKNLTAKIYMVGSTAGVEVEIKDNVRTYRAINHDKKVFDQFVDKRDADKNNK